MKQQTQLENAYWKRGAAANTAGKFHFHSKLIWILSLQSTGVVCYCFNHA